MYIKTTCLLGPHFTDPHGNTLLIIEYAHKDHLCIRTTFCWPISWSLYTSFAVFNKINPDKGPILYQCESSKQRVRLDFCTSGLSKDQVLEYYRRFLRIRPGRQYEKCWSANVKFGHKLPRGR